MTDSPKLEDRDPVETQEWLESIDSVLKTHGAERAHFLLERLIDYTRRSGATNALGHGNNAYTRLLARAHPNPAAINDKTTRSGPKSYHGNRIYRLRNPIPIQHTNPSAAGYVPLDVTAMLNQDYLGNDAWVNALREKAKAQGRPWAPIENNYGVEITAAFEFGTVINDTSYYTASRYDNIFVRNTNPTGGGVIDVISELGSWAIDPSGHNRWPAAAGRLNGLARAKVLSLNGGNLANPVNYAYEGIDYDIYPDLDDATQAAVFFDKFISDHLPVWVEIVI